MILVFSSKRRCLEAPKFAVILFFIPFTTYEKASFACGSEFYEKFSGLSRNELQRSWYKANNALFCTFCSEDPWVLLPLNNKDFFWSLLACSATMSSKGSSPLVYSHKKSVHIEGYMNVTMRKTIRMFFSNSLLIRRNKNGFLLVYEIKLMSEMKWFSIYYKLG